MYAFTYSINKLFMTYKEISGNYILHRQHEANIKLKLLVFNMCLHRNNSVLKLNHVFLWGLSFLWPHENTHLQSDTHTCWPAQHSLGRDQDDRAKCNDDCSLGVVQSENVRTPVHMCALHPFDSILDHALSHRSNDTHVGSWMSHFDKQDSANLILGP
jgi:hypothetical protein